MKKRLLGEKIGLKIELKTINLFVFFFLFSSEVTSQIPVNGFCKLKFYKVTPGYSRIFTLNYNGDAYTDLILFDPAINRISTLRGEKNESFAIEKIYELPFGVSNFAPLKDSNNFIKNYTFASRKNLTAGICEFTADGKLKIKHQLKFNSYPENLSTADIDGDNQQEVILSGPAFSGLSVLRLTENKLIEIKISDEDIYSSAVFIHLSNNKFPDIAAFNVLTNSLVFYFNDGRGNFKLTRSISLVDKASNLIAFDMNLDSYHDLIFSQGKSFKIFYGDFASSYSTQLEIQTKFFPDQFIVGDFNRDGKIDIVYLNIENSIISVLFAEDEFKFYPEIILHRKIGLKSIISFYSKFIDGLAAVCDDGTILTNTRMRVFSSPVDISLNVSAEEIFYLDANNNSLTDICFLDSYDKSLKVLICNIDGVPEIYYSVPLREKQQQLLVDKLDRQHTDFYCFSKQQKLIECVNINFSSGKIFRQEFYSSNPVSDVAILREKKRCLAVASKNNSKLFIEIFHKEGNWKNLSEFVLSENVVDFSWSSVGSMNLFFWTYLNDTLRHFRHNLTSNEYNSELVYKIHFKNLESILTVTDDFFNLDKSIHISFVGTNEKRYILITQDEKIVSHNLNDVHDAILVNDKSQLFSGEIRLNGTKRLIVNNYADKSIYKLSILGRGDKLLFTKIANNVQAKRFFIKNMTTRNYHLIYINEARNCVSINQI